MGTLNRNFDGNKASVICRSTDETLFYCPFMGHKYYENCAMFVILMGHKLAVNNGESQRFKDTGSKQNEYISQFMLQSSYTLKQESENCVSYYKSCKRARELTL